MKLVYCSFPRCRETRQGGLGFVFCFIESRLRRSLRMSWNFSTIIYFKTLSLEPWPKTTKCSKFPCQAKAKRRFLSSPRCKYWSARILHFVLLAHFVYASDLFVEMTLLSALTSTESQFSEILPRKLIKYSGSVQSFDIL